MLKAERQQVIVNEVRIHNKVLFTDIAELLNVSVDTIRRDIKELSVTKKLKKVHGGAISLGFNNYQVENQEIYELENKSRIARKAITLLRSGQVILISGGTTNMEIARMIPPNLKITCFTPSLPVAVQLMAKSDVDVILIGGKLSKDSQIAIGGCAINMLNDIKVDICFLGINSIDVNNGVTDFDWDIVQIKKAMIRASKKIVAPLISEKLNSTQRFKICDLDKIDFLITELEPEDDKLMAFREIKINLL
ncbi:DeoR/GlpR transcriptional regulator [Arenibacter sp. TNZ]|jgi:DeoR/GlpR family transcriptional regulator of sugar metabolism|uniref:DeoR/GlpR family DNA-binding transcription regulator n=1 Tax=Arenibacter TaxID=178469 RepID=UPI000CD3D67C|nr:MULTISPECIES: DeoR/GlpR family DNA-binding transcription regulator [Arenibacter]MCM4173749.1 DeoR/GlpR transcriptional regulator [Arenibacter sp. TNZ]